MSTEKQYYNPEVWGGIECTINRVDDAFNDQLEHSRHYYREGDVELIANLGIKKIRFPILWEKHQPTLKEETDWSWTEKQVKTLREREIDVIAGLVHHGSGPAFTNLLDDNFPDLLAQYARSVAEKFPWIKFYTPVNEPLTTARFSGLYGFWYPHRQDDQSFFKMLLNQVKGIVLSMKAIREINPAAQLIQTEDLGKTYSTTTLKYQADFENERRWLTYDLLCGRVNRQHALWSYLEWVGIEENDLKFFWENLCVPDVCGFNYYITSERFIDERLDLYPHVTPGGNGIHKYVDVEAARIDLDETGVEVLLREAWNRFGLPMAVTEVHLHCHREEQLRWFKYVWNACKNLTSKGVNIEAVTAWALLGSFGWNKLLTQQGGDYEPGVFDIRSGSPRPTALAAFIKNINDQGSYLHRISTEQGWWQRENRFIHAARPINKSLVCAPKHDATILIIGKNGTLGKAFARVCSERYFNYRLLSRVDCNICDFSSIENVVHYYRPWAIINAAGYVRVDDAENDFDQCYDDNTHGAENLAIAAEKFGIKLVTFSTDLVFDGSKGFAYVEDDPVNPLSVYGSSKAEAERLVLKRNPAALIIRTSAFFGPWDEYNFIYYVRRSLLQSEKVLVAADYVISPTYVPDLANATLDLMVDNEKGIWHLTNDGEISWADLAYEIADRYELNRKFIEAVPQDEMKLPAKRPNYSVLSSSRGVHLPSLDSALRRYVAEEVMFDRSKLSTERA